MLLGHTRCQPSWLVLFSCAAMVSLCAVAQGQENYIELRTGYYDQTDGGGDETLEEDQTIIEPVIVLRYQATESLGLTAEFSYDNVSAASIERLSETHGQSGASGDNYMSAKFGFDYAWGESDLAVTLSGSNEYDYTSIGLSTTYGHWLMDRQSHITLSLGSFFDSVEVIRYDGDEEGSDTRTTLSLGFGFEHTLTPTITTSLGYTFTHQSGFLETALNRVLVSTPGATPINPPGTTSEYLNFQGIEIAEELPDARIRHALYGRLDKYLDWSEAPDTAIGLGWRVYSDSWGITAFSVEPSLRQWIVDERLRFELRYRYYSQSAADDYTDVLTSVETYRTADSDLGDYAAHTIGTTLFWQVSERSSLELSLDSMTRNDGLDAVWGSFAWRLNF